MMKTILALLFVALGLSTPVASRAEHEGKMQILLLGESGIRGQVLNIDFGWPRAKRDF
jgi:hypothetical protein